MDRLGRGAPLGGQGLMAAVAVLVGEAAVDRVTGVEGLVLGFRGEDQPMIDRPRRETSLDLRIEG